MINDDDERRCYPGNLPVVPKPSLSLSTQSRHQMCRVARLDSPPRTPKKPKTHDHSLTQVKVLYYTTLHYTLLTQAKPHQHKQGPTNEQQEPRLHNTMW